MGIASAQAQVVPKFPIGGFHVEGNSLLPQAEIDSVLKPFIGTKQDFGDVQRALEALEAAYRTHGFTYVSVLLPEQVLEGGEIRLKVIEARVSKINVSGERFFTAENIRASVPSIKEGQLPVLDDISASIRIANENPAKKVVVKLAPGDQDEDLDVNLTVTDEKPWKVGLTLDNTGTGQAGRYRTGFSYQNSNLFDRDHVLTLQYQTSPENPRDVKVYAVAYRLPLYELGDVVDFYATYSDVNSGFVSSGPLQLAITGKGSALGFRYTNKLKRIGDYEHELTAGLDNKVFKNGIAADTVELGNNLSVNPLLVQYTGRWAQEGRELGFNAGVVQNIPGGRDGDQTAISLARTGASKNYNLIRGAASFSQSLADDWQWRAVATAQWARAPLIPGEQFGVGGANSVRGFSEREVANDKGLQGNLELYSPEVCGKFLPGQQCRLLTFYDFGSVYRNQPLTGESSKEHIASTGVGFRWTVSRDFAVQADYGYVLQGSSTRDAGDWMLHARMGVFF